MGNLLEAVEHAFTHRKLSRNQCQWCSQPFPDDVRSTRWFTAPRYCSNECRQDRDAELRTW